MNHFSQILAVFSLTSFLIAQITVDSTVFKGVVSTQNYDGIDENNLVLIDALFYETFYENETNKPYSGKAFRTYQGGEIKFKGSYIDGKLNGKVSTWYQNGQKESEGIYTDWINDGLFTTWSPNGQESSEVIWKNGKQWDGKVIRWHANGQKKSEFTYKDGEPLHEGKFWDENGDEEYPY